MKTAVTELLCDFMIQQLHTLMEDLLQCFIIHYVGWLLQPFLQGWLLQPFLVLHPCFSFKSPKKEPVVLGMRERKGGHQLLKVFLKCHLQTKFKMLSSIDVFQTTGKYFLIDRGCLLSQFSLRFSFQRCLRFWVLFFLYLIAKLLCSKTLNAIAQKLPEMFPQKQSQKF